MGLGLEDDLEFEEDLEDLGIEDDLELAEHFEDLGLKDNLGIDVVRCGGSGLLCNSIVFP